MSAGLAERAVIGVQTPRVSWMPVGEWDYSLGDECVAWARDALRTFLDPWEALVLRMMLARRPNGKWVCPEFGLDVSRRNGKSHVLIVRFLFGMFVLGDTQAEYTAHHGKTVRATFKLARRLLDGATSAVPDYKPMTSAGRESLLFPDTKQELAFSTRTASAGRGTGGDVLAVDEAQEADDDEMDALSPILGDRSMVGNPQLIYAGSAGKFSSVVFGRVRLRALSGTATRLGWAEWSIDDEAYFDADVVAREALARSVESIAQANPALGITTRAPGSGGLSLEWLLGQIDVLSPPGFAREHLGVGTWPKDDGSDWLIPRLTWGSQSRPDETLPTGSLVFALSASGWDGRSFSIAAVGGLPDGTPYGWLEREDRGSSWVVPELVRLCTQNAVAAVVLDDHGPAGSQADALENALAEVNVKLVRIGAHDTAAAMGALFDAVTADPPEWAHHGDPPVDAALAGAKKKDLGGGLWVLDRGKSQSDIAPLEAVAYARFGWVIYGGVDYVVEDSIW